ncbi:MAG: hypothetical protein LBO09_00710 [Candidatus Peribacteria bacterium]|jgi:hypothetical protein|nr:hypothetical protein [Candidatus Peribacteria bacterium]
MKKNCLWILFLILLLVIGGIFFYQQTPPTSPLPLETSLPEDAIAFSGAERTKETINEQLERRNYCEVDSDCEAFYGECPFDCHITVNKQFVTPAQQLIAQRRENDEKKGNPQCVYGCVQLTGVQCKEQKCVTRND